MLEKKRKFDVHLSLKIQEKIIEELSKIKGSIDHTNLQIKQLEQSITHLRKEHQFALNTIFSILNQIYYHTKFSAEKQTLTYLLEEHVCEQEFTKKFIQQLPSPYNQVRLKPKTSDGTHSSPEEQKQEISKLIKSINPKIFVEIGSYIGLTAIDLAHTLREEGLLYAIDPWKVTTGSVIHNNDFKDGLYNQFLSNVIHAELTHKIIPIRKPSLEAVQTFRDKNMKPDLIYIDGDHSYEAVLKDLEAWYPLLSEQGAICGDDYSLPSGGVDKAVKEFCSKNNLKFETKATSLTRGPNVPWFWIIHKQ